MRSSGVGKTERARSSGQNATRSGANNEPMYIIGRPTAEVKGSCANFGVCDAHACPLTVAVSVRGDGGCGGGSLTLTRAQQRLAAKARAQLKDIKDPSSPPIRQPGTAFARCAGAVCSYSAQVGRTTGANCRKS